MLWSPSPGGAIGRFLHAMHKRGNVKYTPPSWVILSGGTVSVHGWGRHGACIVKLLCGARMKGMRGVD